MEKGDRGLGVALHFPADQVAQSEDDWIRDLVSHRNPVALAFHEAMIMQNGQVLGNIRLLHGTPVHELADRQRTIMQGLQNGKAAGLGKDAEQARDSGELAGGKFLLSVLHIAQSAYHAWRIYPGISQ
jgi:hypothetical protein